MGKQTQLILGGILVLWGILIVVSNVFNIDFSAICWPTLLILLGVAILLRPRWLKPDMQWGIRPIADIKRRGVWTASNEEIWTFVGDVKLDLTEAQIPSGETLLRIFGFVVDVDVRLPADVGLAVSSTAFVNEVEIQGQKNETFFGPINYTSPGYENAERKLRLETLFFVADIDIENNPA